MSIKLGLKKLFNEAYHAVVDRPPPPYHDTLQAIEHYLEQERYLEQVGLDNIEDDGGFADGSALLDDQLGMSPQSSEQKEETAEEQEDRIRKKQEERIREEQEDDLHSLQAGTWSVISSRTPSPAVDADENLSNLNKVTRVANQRTVLVSMQETLLRRYFIRGQYTV